MRGWLVLLAIEASAQSLKLQVETEPKRYSCAQPGAATILGSVVEAGPQRFVLDQCLPTQDCQKVVPAVISLAAPGFAGFQKLLSKGGFVRARFEMRAAGPLCEERLAVDSLGKWLGAPNPAGDLDRFYFAAAANTTFAFPDSGFTVERCPGGKRALRLRSRGGSVHDLFSKGAQPWRASERERWTVALLSLGSCSSGGKWSYWTAGGPN